MATKDGSSGLFSKVAKFVRNPTKDWSELDKPEPEEVSGYSKQALKEMIERKRQNDFVRRREFDQLRKLRRNEPSITPEMADRPSFFQTSTASNPDERAMTLKKIDDIEAQMSKQWWKGKQKESTPTDAEPQANEAPLVGSMEDSPTTIGPGKGDSKFPTTRVELRRELSQDPATGYEPTQMISDIPAMGMQRPVVTPVRSGSHNFDAGFDDFSMPLLSAMELGGGLSDPDMEEAAIRFANGDDEGAEEVLLNALESDGVSPQDADHWAAALFDLYRATAEQAKFDRVALDYAQRFGRSAPAWFSIPELLGLKVAAARSPEPVSNQQSVWVCPARLDAWAMQSLRSSLIPTAQPWQIDWSRLSELTADAASDLAELFSQWCMQPVKLQFAGADVLERVLRTLTPSGDRRTDMTWWRLRLDAMRVLRLQDEFELAALDFCVTFEVSPPAWTDPRCDCIAAGAAGQFQGSGPDLRLDTPTSGAAGFYSQATVPMSLDTLPAAMVELTGEVMGDASDVLEKFQAGMNGADRLVVSCTKLIRVDFSAAGSILNWAAACESKGCRVKFHDVPRLIAAFFSVIGINEHAIVSLRTN